MLTRVHGLEKDIQHLKAELQSETKPHGILSAIQQFGKLLVSNWVLVSFLVAIATTVYVKLEFKIDYFEDYRNASVTKSLSEFYRQLGDRMMIYNEWSAAEAAYRTALEVNPRNITATYGVIKSQLFQPQEENKYYAAEVVDAKLNYLSAQFPNDPDIFFLRAIRLWHQNQFANAKSF